MHTSYIYNVLIKGYSIGMTHSLKEASHWLADSQVSPAQKKIVKVFYTFSTI